MPNLNGGHLFIRCLKQEGVKRVFTIVGDTVLPLVDAAADEGIAVHAVALIGEEESWTRRSTSSHRSPPG